MSRPYNSGQNFQWSSRGHINSHTRNRNPYINGEVSRCNVCQSIFHWERDCTDKRLEFLHLLLKYRNVTLRTLLVKHSTLLFCCFVVLDSGCTKTVCGKVWYDGYVDTLSEKGVKKIRYEDVDMIW